MIRFKKHTNFQTTHSINRYVLKIKLYDQPMIKNLFYVYLYLHLIIYPENVIEPVIFQQNDN